MGHLTFQKIFWSKSPPWGPKTGSNKIKYPHLREVISLKFIVVVVYILQIIDINCQAFFLYFKLLRCFAKARHYQKSTQSPQSKVFHQFILTTSSEKQCFCLQKRVLTSKTAVLSSQRSSEFQDGRHRRD